MQEETSPNQYLKKIVATLILIAVFSIGFVSGKSTSVEARQANTVSDVDFAIF